MDKTVEITIDGKEIKTQEGANLLQVAIDNGINIPNMCYHKKVSHTGACRLCIVKIDGRRGMAASCTTAIEDGMKVIAFDEELEKTRKSLLDMMLSNHNDDCISCSQDGECQLQDLAFKYNLAREDRALEPIWRENLKEHDESSPILDYDASRCIQCQRCVKACYEIQGKGVLSAVNRGIKSQVAAGLMNWEQSECDGCGECVQNCPVGALTVKSVYSEQKLIRGKDVDKVVQTTCPYCGVGCQLDVATIGGKIVKVDGSEDMPNYGKTCVKGRFGLDFVDSPERLTKPLIKKKGKFEEVSFEEAIKFTADKFKAIKDKHGSDAIAGLSSARCTNEENFVFQKFIRSVCGTNNVDHCARLCHASTVAGLATTLGSGAMTNSIEELERADVILVTGSNTTETHPVIATLIKRAVLFNGAKLIVVDPRRIELVKYATIWLRQNGGTDVAWANGLMNIILSENLQAAEYIKERTEGFDDFKKVVDSYTPEVVAKVTGIPEEKLIEAAKIYAGAQKASIVYSMGITQHSNGTDNVKSMANLALLTGNLGIESGGVNPLRGQNNVQGACDMGALPNVYPGYQKVVEDGPHAKFEKAWNAKLSNKLGLTVTEIVNAAEKGDVRGLYIMGENPMVSDPNITHVKEALEKTEFLVCQDIFLTETAQLADVVFPAASFAEKDGNYTNTERRILPVNPIVESVGESKPDWAITQMIAQAMGADWSYTGIKDIIDEINLLTPQYGGITYERIQAGEKLQWPCLDKDHAGTKYLHKGKFARGLGLFSAIEHTDPDELPNKKFPFALGTGRNLYHYHTGTMSRKTKTLPAFNKEAYVEMNKEDIKDLGVSDGDKVKVSTKRGAIEITARETNRVNKGYVFIPFHFVEAAANMLTNDKVDPVAKIPELKICACKVEKIK